MDITDYFRSIGLQIMKAVLRDLDMNAFILKELKNQGILNNFSANK